MIALPVLQQPLIHRIQSFLYLVELIMCMVTLTRAVPDIPGNCWQINNIPKLITPFISIISYRYPPGMRRMTSNPRRPPPSRFIPPPPPQQPPLRAISPAVPPSTDSLLVAYTMDGFNSTLAKRVQSNQLTLGEFKEKVFARRGHYR